MLAQSSRGPHGLELSHGLKVTLQHYTHEGRRMLAPECAFKPGACLSSACHCISCYLSPQQALKVGQPSREDLVRGKKSQSSNANILDVLVQLSQAAPGRVYPPYCLPKSWTLAVMDGACTIHEKALDA